MDAHIKKVYVPMTETGFYILLCLRTPNHGYGIVQKVKELTEDEVVLGPGTMYGSLSKMEKDGLIQRVSVASDARLKSLVPTEKAVHLDAQVEERLHRAEQCLTQGLSDVQLTAFKEAAAQMAANLDN
mgnify:CR=1 FL=1